MMTRNRTKDLPADQETSSTGDETDESAGASSDSNNSSAVEEEAPKTTTTKSLPQPPGSSGRGVRPSVLSPRLSTPVGRGVRPVSVGPTRGSGTTTPPSDASSTTTPSTEGEESGSASSLAPPAAATTTSSSTSPRPKSSSGGGGSASTAPVIADDGRGYDLNKKIALPADFKNKFAARDTESNIIFMQPSAASSEEGPVIKGGTIYKLVERLTLPDQGDPTFVKTFLLTYRSFTTPMDLLQLLINRFYCPVDDESDLELRRSIQKPVRLRVFAVLKVWITGYSYDFEDDPELVARFEQFCNVEIGTVMSSGSRQLLVLLEKALSREELTKKRTPISSKEIPKPHLPTCRPSELSLLTIHPQEFARQLTLIEADLFRAIKPWELLNLAWSRKDKEQKAPNVLAMIARSNVITPWISSQIVSSRSMKVRAEILTRSIQTMQYLEELHNFNAIMEFIAALQNAGVFRLKETWARLDKKHKRAWDMLMARMSRDNNFKVFRESLRTVSPPSIPYLGMFLTDLTFIEDGNPDYLDDDKTIINVAKRMQYSQIIKDIQMYQQTPYLLQPVPMIADFLNQLNPPTQEQVYDTSLTIKARSEGSKEVDDVSAENQGAAKPKTAPVKIETDNWGELDFPKGYPFAEPDSDDNIDVDTEDHKLVLYASIPKLVERLTYEKYSDQTFVTAFLLTYQLILPAERLMELLVQRYNVPFPKKADADIKSKFEAKVVRPVRLRVFNALKQWVDKYPKDFADNQTLSDKLEAFAETMKATGMQKPAERLVEGVAAARSGNAGDEAKKSAAAAKRQLKPPSVVNPKSGSVKDCIFLDLPAQEIARQLTLIESGLYRAITDREVLMWIPYECLSQDSVDHESTCPTVHALSEHNEWLSSMTVSLIVSQDGKDVARMIEHLCFIADHLRNLNNFNGFRAVMEGLLHPEVAELESAWVSISSPAAKTFDGLKDLLEEIKTYYKNQQWMQKVSAPALPSLRSYLDELARIEKALPDKIEESIHPGELIHMAKRLQQAKAVTDFLMFQGTEFALEEVPEYATKFSAVKVLSAEEVTSIVRRLNNDEVSANGAASSSSDSTTPPQRHKSSMLQASKNRLPAATTSSPSLGNSASSGINSERSSLNMDRSSGKLPSVAAGSPRMSQQIRTGIQRRPSKLTNDAVDSSSPVVTQEWVQQYVQNAIAEATAPLLAEIERLKAKLENPDE